MTGSGEQNGKTGKSGGGGNGSVERHRGGNCEGAGGRGRFGGGELRIQQSRWRARGERNYREGRQSHSRASGRVQAGGHHAAVRGNKESLRQAQHPGEQRGDI